MRSLKTMWCFTSGIWLDFFCWCLSPSFNCLSLLAPAGVNSHFFFIDARTNMFYTERFFISDFEGFLINNRRFHHLPSLKLTWPLKMDSWKMYFLLGGPIFRCYVSFREGISWLWVWGLVLLDDVGKKLSAIAAINQCWWSRNRAILCAGIDSKLVNHRA